MIQSLKSLATDGSLWFGPFLPRDHLSSIFVFSGDINTTFDLSYGLCSSFGATVDRRFHSDSIIQMPLLSAQGVVLPAPHRFTASYPYLVVSLVNWPGLVRLYVGVNFFVSSSDVSPGGSRRRRNATDPEVTR